MDDNFMTWVIEESVKEGTLLALALKEESVRCMKAGSSHGCSDNVCEVQEPERREQGKSRITTLDFR